MSNDVELMEVPSRTSAEGGGAAPRANPARRPAAGRPAARKRPAAGAAASADDSAQEAAPEPAAADGEPKLLPPERRKAPRFIAHKPWKYYGMTLVPLLLLLGGAAPFHHFITEVTLANIVLNGLIISVLFLGAGIIFMRVRAVQKEFGYLNQLTNAYLEGKPFTEVLQDPTIYYSGVGHVIVHIAETEGKISSGLTQTAVNEELDHFQHHFQAGYEVPNYIVGFMIAMGLTGTFIGLLETMLGISAMLGGINTGGGGDMSAAVMGLITELQKPLAGMGTAFSASLFGLIGSVVLGMMMLALKFSVTEFMSALRRYINGVVEHDIVAATAQGGGGGGGGRGGQARSRAPKDSSIGTFIEQVVDAQMQSHEAFKMSQEHTVNLGVRIDKLADSLDAVGEMLKAQMETQKKVYELIAFGPRMRDLADETLSETRKMVEMQRQQAELMTDSIRGVSQLEQRLNGIGVAMQGLQQWMVTDSNQKQGQSKAILAAITTLQERTTQVVQEAEQTRNVNIDMARHMAANAESQKKLVDLLGFGGRMRDIADQQLSELKILNSMQRESTGSFEQLGTLMANLDQRFVRIDTQLTQWATEFGSKNDATRNELKAIGESFGTLQKIMTLVAREASQNRGVSIDIARHLTEANNNLVALKGGNELLTKIQDGAASQVGVLNVLVNEVRNARSSVVRDLRTEIRSLAEVLGGQEGYDEEAYDEEETA